MKTTRRWQFPCAGGWSYRTPTPPTRWGREQLDLSSTAGGCRLAVTLENCLAISYKIKHTSGLWPRNSIYSRGMKTHVHKKDCKRTFIVALLIIAKNCKEKQNLEYPSTEDWTEISALVTQRTITRQWTRSVCSNLRERSDQISCSVVSDSLRPHESQHARPPCPSPTLGVHSDSHPSSQWCHPAISSSAVPFSS